MLEVTVVSPQEVIFKGSAKSVILPGERGIFEILPFHKPLLSRLIAGRLIVDQHSFEIIRGIVKVTRNSVTAVVEGGEVVQ